MPISTHRRWHTLSTLALVAVAAACGGTSPTSPAPAGNVSASARIEGRVSTQSAAGLSGTASQSPSSATTSPLAGMRVRVIGTSVETTVTSAGTFSLANVPAGQARLQFSSAAVDATADLGAVAASDIIQVQVQVSATAAVIVSQSRANEVSLCHTEGNGTYHSISVSPDAEAAHRAHGDGKVGDPVPGRPNMFFDASCRLIGPAVELETSTNGEDADSAPGPTLVVGAALIWEYRIANTGTVALTSVAVTDDKGVVVTCPQTTVAAGATMTCTGTGVATLGQYRNVGTVTASWTMTTPAGTTAAGTVTASDASHYLGVASVVETPKVTLCHRTGSDKWVEITVSIDAEPAHRAHGDAKIGEAVPGQTGKVFGSGCRVQ